MKKYIKPVMDIHRISLAKVMMVGASDGSGNVVKDGGNTSDAPGGSITEGSAKRRRGRGIFDDGEPEGFIW